jgi:transcriptional regulator with XRE-family HTH domain
MEIGQKIRKARLAKNMTQEELGKVVGLQKSAIAKYESGRVVNIKRSTIQKLALALDLRGSDLIIENSEKEKPTVQDDGLSENKRRLIEFARSVPDDKAEMILQVMRTIVEAD